MTRHHRLLVNFNTEYLIRSIYRVVDDSNDKQMATANWWNMFRARGRKNIEKRALNRILPLHLHLAPCMQCVQLFFFQCLLSLIAMLSASSSASSWRRCRCSWTPSTSARERQCTRVGWRGWMHGEAASLCFCGTRSYSRKKRLKVANVF